jgi:peroxiredoxin
MNLKEEINKLKEQNLKKMPKEVVELFLADVKKQLDNGVTDNALKIGDHIPEFEIPNAVGETISSKELLSKGPLIISFYRGAWCPYCNLELLTYQEVLPEINSIGAQLIAISPQLPDKAMPLIEKHSLEYEVLSDLGNKVAKEFGLVFHIGKELQEGYKMIGLDLVTPYGNDNYDLPLAATYVVDTDGTIISSCVDYDYTNRLEPSDAIEAIKNLNK